MGGAGRRFSREVQVGDAGGRCWWVNQNRECCVKESPLQEIMSKKFAFHNLS